MPLPEVPSHLHDPDWQRPVRARYADPLDLVWLATAARLGLHVRRDPTIFSRTDGKGLLALGPRPDLDADDCLAQMIFHELCHWITNGLESFAERDWGFALDDGVDPREHACLRVQAWLADRWGLRDMLGPTGIFRQYYDRIPPDPLQPIDGTAWERDVVALAAQAIDRATGEPWGAPLAEALRATADMRRIVQPFLAERPSEMPDDPLPSLWKG